VGATLLELFGRWGSISLLIGVGASLLLAGAGRVPLRQLWALLDTLQILTHLPLLYISFPPNVVYLASQLRDIANLNILPKEAMSELICLFVSPLPHKSDLQGEGRFLTMDIF
jgi:hypothetical protein